jgi:NAD(P)-dependent dehydrogenase (short-subunit alcohol dehydrogenase family)
MAGLDLTGKTVLVTGGAQGLGAGMAEALSAVGASVMIADIMTDLGEKTAAGIPRATFVPLDVTSDEQWATATDTTIAEFGGLDVVINNAGIEVTQLVIDTDADALRSMLDVNVVGTALGLKHAFRAMCPGGPAGRGGAVINVASVAAAIAFPAISGYSATKSAIDRLTRVAAMESGKLGYGVRVNCILPGLVATEMGMKLAVETAGLGLFETPEAAVGTVVELTPSGRLGEVDDMADAVVFLASDQSRFVNGVALRVDGGMGM